MRLQEGGWTDSGKEKKPLVFPTMFNLHSNDAFADISNRLWDWLFLGLQLPIDKVIRCYRQTECLIRIHYERTLRRTVNLQDIYAMKTANMDGNKWSRLRAECTTRGLKVTGCYKRSLTRVKGLMLKCQLCLSAMSSIFGLFFSVTILLHLANAEYDDSEKFRIISTY